MCVINIKKKKKSLSQGQPRQHYRYFVLNLQHFFANFCDFKGIYLSGCLRLGGLVRTRLLTPKPEHSERGSSYLPSLLGARDGIVSYLDFILFYLIFRPPGAMVGTLRRSQPEIKFGIVSWARRVAEAQQCAAI